MNLKKDWAQPKGRESLSGREPMKETMWQGPEDILQEDPQLTVNKRTETLVLKLREAEFYQQSLTHKGTLSSGKNHRPTDTMRAATGNPGQKIQPPLLTHRN